MNRFKESETLKDHLNSIPKFQSSGLSSVHYSLDNIRGFCEEAGDIHKDFKCIHIAGTNGKGTTAALLELVYRKAGYKTGLFTSPHLLEYNERVQINGTKISDEDMLIFFNTWIDKMEEWKLSYFEISTALAFWKFSRDKVDVAMIETGLGGRLDATNIIRPELSLISSIGYDHMDLLGDTLEEIASEKAGIIKQDVPIVTGNVHGNALEVIKTKAGEVNSPIIITADSDPNFIDGNVYMSDLPPFETSLLEDVNKWNIASTILAVRELSGQFPMTDKQLRSGISEFRGLPGRFERLSESMDWYFSGAHNQEALMQTMQTVSRLFDEREVVMIFSLMKDKLKQDVINLLKPVNSTYFVEQEGERAVKFVDIKALMNVKEINEENYLIILNELKTSLVIFTGSFYFYPIIKRWVSQIDQYI